MKRMRVHWSVSKFLLAHSAGIPQLTAVKRGYTSILGQRLLSLFALVACSLLVQSQSYKALYPARLILTRSAEAR